MNTVIISDGNGNGKLNHRIGSTEDKPIKFVNIIVNEWEEGKKVNI